MRKIKTTLEEANEAHSYKWLFPISFLARYLQVGVPSRKHYDRRMHPKSL